MQYRIEYRFVAILVGIVHCLVKQLCFLFKTCAQLGIGEKRIQIGLKSVDGRTEELAHIKRRLCIDTKFYVR